MSKKFSFSLATQILIALVLAVIAGTCFSFGGDKATAFAGNYIKPFGTIFLNLVKFVVVPVVLFSIMSGVLSMKDIKQVGSIGVKSVVFYLITTFFAIIIGLAGGMLFKGIFPALETSQLVYNAKGSMNIMQTIVDIFPANFIAPLNNAVMLQVIVMAIIISFAILTLGEKAKKAADAVNLISDIFIKCMEIILAASPIGVFCLLTPVIATNGVAVIGSLAKVIGVAYLCYAFHIIVVYSMMVKGATGISPLTFFKKMSPAMLFAFSSASSVGTLPLNMTCTEKLGAKKEVSSFTLPLGATINMDGTAIYQGVCAIFIASCYGITLTFPQLITIVLTATLASIGTAGVPGAGMIMLSMVLASVGLPVEGIALVAGVDRIFDMGRTVLNITGDAACTVCISHLEDKRLSKVSENQ